MGEPLSLIAGKPDSEPDCGPEIPGEVTDEEACSLEDAESEAAALLLAAREKGREDGCRQAYREAFNERLSQSEASALEIRKNLETELAQMQSREEELLDRAGRQALPLGFELAEVILRIALEEDENAFPGLFAKAAARVTEAGDAVLKTGPKSGEYALRHLEDLKKRLRGLKTLTLKANGEDNGLCIIETPFGSVDASVKTQLDKAKKTVFIGEFPE